MRVHHQAIILSMLLSAGLTPAFAAEPAKSADLGQYVPGDAWLYMRMIDAPSRDFLDPHWDRVFNALAASGINREWKRALAGDLSESERAEFEQTWQMITERFNAVHWRDLIAQEMVFAERLGGLIPDIIFLCRPAAASRDQSVQGLSDILRTLASLDKDGDFRFREYQDGGVRVWSIEFTHAPVGLYLLHKDEVVGLIMGRAGCADVIALLNGCAAQPPIVASPRLRQALTRVPKPEFNVGFLDFKQMFSILPRYPEMMLGHAQQETKPEDLPKIRTIQRVFKAFVHHFEFLDYMAFSGTMEGRQEVNHTYVRIRPEYADRPLCRMSTQRELFRDFHRYLPKETLSFSVSAFIDLEILYDTALEVIRTELPDGPSYLQKWAELQSQWDFNVREDVLSWLSGESIYVTLPAAVPNPYGAGDGVWLVRVSDPEKAKAKLHAGLDRLQAFMTAKDQVLIVGPAGSLPVEGFRNVNHPLFGMLMTQPCIGIWRDWLVIGTSEASVLKVMQTADGKRPSIKENARFASEGMHADGTVYAASFTDLSQFNEQLTSMFIGMGFFGEMMPNEPETRTVKAMINSLGRLGPVVSEIDFYSSMGSVTTFDGEGWRTVTKITYEPDK